MRISDWSSDVCSSDLAGATASSGAESSAAVCASTKASSGKSAAGLGLRRPLASPALPLKVGPFTAWRCPFPSGASGVSASPVSNSEISRLAGEALPLRANRLLVSEAAFCWLISGPALGLRLRGHDGQRLGDGRQPPAPDRKRGV